MVTLPRFVTEALAEHLAAHGPGAGGLMFGAPEGGPLRRHTFRQRYWLTALERLGWGKRVELADKKRRVFRPDVRFHDLRHTTAALAIRAGAHPKAIQERLGHASITTTLDRYGHLFPALDEELAGLLDALGRDARPGDAGPARDQGGTATSAPAADRAESGR